jgi:hypothetical protein
MAVANTFRAVYIHRYASMRSERASVAMEKAHGTTACAGHAGTESVIGRERLRRAACCTNSRQHLGGLVISY